MEHRGGLDGDRTHFVVALLSSYYVPFMKVLIHYASSYASPPAAACSATLAVLISSSSDTRVGPGRVDLRTSSLQSVTSCRDKRLKPHTSVLISMFVVMSFSHYSKVKTCAVKKTNGVLDARCS